MKDSSQHAIIELRQTLSQIISWVSAKEAPRMILAQRPLRLSPDIQNKRQPAPALQGDSKFKSSWFIAQNKKEAMHAIRFPYLCYVIEGEIDMRLGIPVRQSKLRGAVNNYDILTLPANTALLIPPGVFFPDGSQLHWERAPMPPADSRIFWLHILPTGSLCHTCSTQKSFHALDNYGIFVHDLQLATLTEMLIEALQSSDIEFSLAASSALSLLLCRIHHNLVNSAMTSKGRASHSQYNIELAAASARDTVVPTASSVVVERACAYIQRQSGVTLGIDEIANHVYVSPSHLRKLFRTKLNTTVMKYVLEQRMEAARSMLANTEISIKEIARFSGYMQPPQFNQVFKQVHHVTPMEFRQRHRNSGN